MNLIIREYQEIDRPQIIKWIENLHDYLVKIDPDKRFRRQPEYGEIFFNDLLDFVKNGQGKIFIALDQVKYIGFSAGAIDTQSKKNLSEVVPSKLGVVCDVYVEDNYRGKGIGTELLKKLENYFKSLNCDSLWLNVVAFNPAHDLYQKLGYRDREIGMFKKL
jgi:GNAT superfamily N-acetyltransferase